MRGEISRAWSRLESETPRSSAPRISQLRVHADSGKNIWASLDSATRQVGMFLEVDSGQIPPISRYPSTSVFRTFSSLKGQVTKITIKLEDNDCRSVFGELCEDVVRHCLAASDQRQTVLKLVDRLRLWEELFRKGRPGVLGMQKQNGLHGELLFLEQLLSLTSQNQAIESWKGPFQDPHDFHIGRCHVEIKTTCMEIEGRGDDQTSIVRISGLRQLDSTGLAALYLWVYRLAQTRSPDSRSLADVVANLEARLDEPPTRQRFQDLLLGVGYLRSHEDEHYKIRRYEVKGTNVFGISDAFPCLTSAEVPAAVVEADYVLDLGKVDAEFGSSEQQVFHEVEAALKAEADSLDDTREL